MLAKSVLILLLSVSLHYIVNAQSGSCSDLELGPPQNFVAHVDHFLFLSWLPPSGFGNCQVSYTLHIQNMNSSSDYFIPIQRLSSLNFVFDYKAHDRQCFHVRALLYSNYNGQTSASFGHITAFLDPVVALGPPSYLILTNEETHLNIAWGTPLGLETCNFRFVYWLSIFMNSPGSPQIGFPMTGNRFSFGYPVGHPLFCQDVNVTVQASFHGGLSSISDRVILGPPGNCPRGLK